MAAAPSPHARGCSFASVNKLCPHPAAKGGASRHWRCLARRATYATHNSEQPLGRMHGISPPPGNAYSCSAATTGEALCGSAAGIPPWPNKRAKAATRTRSRIPRG
jgi:hypothetical protein